MGKVLTARHLDLPDEYALRVGKIIFYWATLEHEMVDIIGIALKIGKKERRILMSKMDPKAKVAMLKVIASKFVKRLENRQHLNNLAKAASPLYDMRNRFAHGAWCHPLKDPDRYDILVIDSGETAYLPTRMEGSIPALDGVVAHFRAAVQAANTVAMLLAQELGSTEVDDDDSSVMGGPVTDAPLEIVEDPTNHSD